MVNVGQTHRWFDAGEASRGGEPRVLPTGLGLARGAQLRDADARPHPTVVVAWPGSGQSGAGDELGGGRSSGASGDGAAVRKQARRSATEALRDARSALGACPGPNGHRSITGDECGRRRVSVNKGATATTCDSENRQGRRGRSSRRVQRWPRRARGSTGASGAARGISGVGRLKKTTWRHSGASGVAQLDEEEEGY